MMPLTRLTLIGLPLLVGCSALVPEAPPPLALPTHYSSSGDQRPLGPPSATPPRADQATNPWWQSYGAPALDALVEEGLAQNASLTATRHALDAARASLRAQIGASELPNASLNLGQVRQRSLNLPGMLPSTYQDSITTGSLDIGWRFNLLGATTLANRAAAKQLQQQAWQYQAAQRTLALNIVTTSIQCAALQADLEQMTALLAAQEEIARLTALRVQLGALPVDAQLAAAQQAADSAAQIAPRRALLTATRHALAILLGRPPEQAPAPLPFDSLHLPAALPLVVPSVLLQQRPDIQAADAAMQAAAQQVGAARAALFPTLTLSASAGHGGYDWSTLTSPAGLIWRSAATLSQPLFQGGALVAQKDAAQAQYQAAQAQYHQTVLDALRDVADALADVQQDAERRQASTQADQAAYAHWQNMLRREQLGANSHLDSLSAQMQYHQQHSAAVQAQAAQLSDSAHLQSAMGLAL